MTSQEDTIQDLNRRIHLLDEYASTLEKQNLAKNNQTATIYSQLEQIRNQNDILRSHLSRINQENAQRRRKEQLIKETEKKNIGAKCVVQLHQIKEENQQKNPTQTVSISCQTEFVEPQVDLTTVHQSCTQEIEKLLRTISEKDIKITEISKESQQMYDTIVHLQEENESIKRQLYEVELKFKTQAKQLKSYQVQVEDMKAVLNEEREAIENEKRSLQEQRESSSAAEFQVDRLIRENNRLIEKIRMLEKEKNSFYAELRGKNVSPLKTSQISARQANIPTEKRSFIGVPAYSSEQKAQPQRFSSQFGIGKQKQKLKADRWRQIQEKINQVKEQNQQLRANLTIV